MDMPDWKTALAAATGYTPVPDEPSAAAAPADPVTLQGRQVLDVSIDRRNRRGKTATIISGFLADDAALLSLAADLKRLCGTGGSARGGEILIQGDCRQRVAAALRERGFKVRII